ncbi:MazG nucleotide pyrophosphohydrolase domain-containing protein [Desulforhopalus singaporensis]|uniref:Tetrapyrrole methylase family protein / MazG family protein n=1 Tax=Desulforhopalus singaporensis TaxID=91360 RepID=A0A1H0PFR5_9BACT|nr:MazG nucleotide pyrophosphohydrolase domain-containing protein [Desulforhopalus singaporensis]SDP03871.1 tetrapyrrole methylase family protein / MazG family protein [Desulforhopalus singaporensis]
MTQTNQNLQSLLETIRILRGEHGCPWDKKQTALSMVKYLKSECQELTEALEQNQRVGIREELGDLLYIILMLSEIHAGENLFTLDEVINDINEKLIRRHPHVFAGTTYSDEAELTAQWNAIKAEEKKKKYI